MTELAIAAAPPRDAWTVKVQQRWWLIASLCLATLVIAPLLVILSGWVHVDAELWSHLAAHRLPELLWNTLVLVTGTGIGVMVLGVGLAWLTSMCQFPGRGLFDWALMLPLAVPAYVLAFVALGLFDFAGPIQALWSALFGRGEAVPEIRGAGTVIAIMVLVFYPYVYMLARSAFLVQGRSAMEAARVLGLGPWQAFFKVSLPMARPAIAAGMALALMETLADFGAVSVFNYDTFTTAIYSAWFGLFSLEAAAQLASLLLLLVAVGLFGERAMRRGARYHGGGRSGHQPLKRLRGRAAWAATAAASLVLLLSFVLPVAQLLWWVWQDALGDLDARYVELLTRTVLLGAGAAALTVSGAAILAYTKRQYRNPFGRGVIAAATLGYALPGSVLAVGIMVVFTGVDGLLADLAQRWFGLEFYQLLGGSVLGLYLAYVVRFMNPAFGAVDSALERITPSIPEAARGLGVTQWQLLRRVYLPMLRPGLLTGALLVLVDVMKEMPATLLLRPFGWDTLAVRIFEMTSEGEWERAALPALTLVLVGLLPVILLVRRSGR